MPLLILLRLLFSTRTLIYRGTFLIGVLPGAMRLFFHRSASGKPACQIFLV
uniref:Uncharacterized protein n=1 Tax=uncultured marine virus TaxID=186617 RepID=A0A0F7L4P1_9VIRU|nr:hypothetical protein [uncultured marine virus]